MTDILHLMVSGDWYNCLDPDLETQRVLAREAVHQHNTMAPSQRGACGPALRSRFEFMADTAWIEAPFHCSYGFNTRLHDGVYLNAGCVFLDSARIEIGRHSMLGPGVHLYCADHHRDAKKRREGMERALPISIGSDVWIGGGAKILPGVTIGDEAIVAAGAVVTSDVPRRTRVAGVPARAL